MRKQQMMKMKPHRGAVSLKIFEHDLDKRTANMLCSQSVLQIDTETEGLDFRKHKLMLVQIATKARRVYVVQCPSITSFNLINVLESHYPKKIFHHLMFDAKFIFAYLLTIINNPACTKTLMKIAKPGLGSGLASAIDSILGAQVPNIKVDYTKWGIKELSKDQKEYICNDVVYLNELYGQLASSMAQEQWGQYQRAMRVIPEIVELEVAGYEDLLRHKQDLPDVSRAKRLWWNL